MDDPRDDWHSDHAANLKRFLESPTGVATLKLLRSLKPAYAKSTETNDIVRQTGRQEGAENTLDNLFLITKPEFLQPLESDSTAYPSLDDEKQWTTDKDKEE
jgi:hypothetical protein